jgi:hypothetical protein
MLQAHVLSNRGSPTVQTMMYYFACTLSEMVNKTSTLAGLA